MMPRIRVRIPLDLSIMSSFARCQEAYSEPGIILTQDDSRKGRAGTTKKNNRYGYVIFFPFQTLSSRNAVK